MSTRDRLVQRFVGEHPGDAARLLEAIGADEVAALLAVIEPAAAAGVLRCMAAAESAYCLAQMDTPAAARVLARMSLDTAAGLLRRLPGDAREALLAALRPDVAGPLGRLLRYPDGTAGALMDPRVLALPADLDAGEALERVRRSPEFTLYYVYVVDRDGRLAGVLNLRELMLAPPHDSLASHMHTDVAFLGGSADRDSVLAHPAWRRLHALPVVAHDRVFLGVIRYETLRGIEHEGRDDDGDTLGTVVRLGELCWIGMAGMLAGLATAVTPAPGDGGRAGGARR